MLLSTRPERGGFFERSRARDVDVFALLYAEHAALVYRIARAMLGSDLAAEDCVQDIFMKVWRHRQILREDDVTRWLARVTRNYCIDRRRLARGSAVIEPSEDAAPLFLPPPMTSVEARIDAIVIDAALRSLPDRERIPIVLNFFAGLTHDQIARETLTPLGTTKKRIRTGLQRLRPWCTER